MLTLLALAALPLAAPPASATAVAPCQSAPAQTPSLPATIPIELWGNQASLKACVDGHELDFILDTGAGATSLDLETAKQLGLKLGQTGSVGGAGPSRVASAQLEGASATIVGTSFTQPLREAIDLARLPPLEGHRMDGILGEDFIGRYVVAIDYERRELRIYDRDSFRYDGPGVSVPVTLINAFPHIDADVKLADGRTLRGRMVVDVGSNASLSLTKTFVDEHRLRELVGPTIRRTGGGGVGGATTSDIARVEGLTIGGIELSHPLVALFGDSAGVMSRSNSWEGNIGGAILRRFTLYLDYHARRMIFEPNSATSQPFESDMSGVVFRMNDALTTIIVDIVAPGSPAAEAGLMRGDVILSADGVPGSQRVLGELRERLHRAGERVSFVVRRGGEEKMVEVVTRRLI